MMRHGSDWLNSAQDMLIMPWREDLRMYSLRYAGICELLRKDATRGQERWAKSLAQRPLCGQVPKGVGWVGYMKGVPG